MKYLSAIFILALFLGSCKDDTAGDQQADVITEDSTERLDTVFSQADVNYLNQLKFSGYAQSQNAAVNWNSFRMVTSSHNDSLIVTKFQPNKAFWD